MGNPETSSTLTPDVMYQYKESKNIPWNIVQYNPLKDYVDPIKQINERKIKDIPKGKPSSKHETKKGFYLDYHIKTMKQIPDPSHYNLKDPFDQEANRKRGISNKIDQKLIKYTYIDKIQMEQKNRKKPGPGVYNLNKTDSEIKQELKSMKCKKINHGQKRFFYQNFEQLSNQVPGMGTYNPHLSIAHIRVQKTDPKYWIERHRKMSQSCKKKRLSQTAPGCYTPCRLDVTTFDRIMSIERMNRQKKNTKSTGFGTDAKFPYQRKCKTVVKQQRPCPTSYQTGIQWMGKKKQAVKNNWVRSISTGLSKSIYNS